MLANWKLKRILSIITICFCSLFPTASSLFEFIVDPTNETQYPSLQLALLEIYENGYLWYDDCIITLSSTCEGTDQYFPAVQIIGYSSLTIQYSSSDSPVSQLSDCSLLPKLVIGNGNPLDVVLLSALTFNGLNIQYAGDQNFPSQIYLVLQVTFSNICFNNSEPSQSLPNDYQGVRFYVAPQFEVTITNMIFLNDGFKTFVLLNMQQLTIMNLTLVQLPWAISSEYPIIITNLASPDDSLNSMIEISNLSIICDPTSTVIPYWFYINNFGSASITNLSFSGCSSQTLASAPLYIFFITCGSFLTIDGLIVANSEQNIPFYATMMLISNINTTNLSNFQISNVISNSNLFIITDQFICKFGDTIVYSTNITLENWVVSNSQFYSHATPIAGYFLYKPAFTGALLDNFTISNVSLTNCYFFWFELSRKTFYPMIWDPMSMPPLPITVQNLNLQNNTLENSAQIIQVTITEAELVVMHSVESIHLKLSNVVMDNNTFRNQSIGIVVAYVATSITNLTGDNNTFLNSGFFLNNREIASFFLSNSTLRNLTLDEQSSFIGADLALIDYKLMVDSSFQKKNQDGDTIGSHAQTRPLIIYNCSFQQIQVSSSSYFMNAVNPMIIYHQNYASMTLKGSNFLELGSYPNFLTYADYARWDELLYLLNKSKVYPFSDAESYLFQDDEVLYSIYTNTKNTIYDQENCVFFISLEGNVFDAMNASGQATLLAISNFQVPNSSITLSNNTFKNISSNGSVNLISGGELANCYFINQLISNVDSQGYFFTYITSTIDFLLLKDITITSTQKLGLYNLVADKCGKIIMKGNQASRLQTQSAFINIACALLDGQVYLQDSKFEEIDAITPSQLIQPLRFMSFTMKKSLLGTLYAFENNSFSNIKITQQRNSQEKFQSSFLFISSLSSSISFNNNTFELITMLSAGSVFEIYVQTFNISNSTLKKLSHSSSNGAINAVFSSLIISGSKFDEIVTSKAIGVLKITNPNLSDKSVVVNISESSFSNNVALSMTLISLTDSSVSLSLNNTQIINNRALTDAGTLFYLLNLQSSNISANRCNFTQNDAEITSSRSQISVFALLQSQGNVKLEIQNSTMSATEQTNGKFILIEGGQHNDRVLISGLNYLVFSRAVGDSSSSGSSEGSSTQFALFEGENIQVIIQDLNVSQLQLNQNGLITINCNPPITDVYECTLQLRDSIIQDLILEQPIITINSQASSSLSALDNLTILIENSVFANITWPYSSVIAETGGSTGQGIISSTTSQIGRSSTQDDFAITFKNCSISKLRGSYGLVYNGIETRYDLVLLLFNNSIDSVNATGPGGVIHASTSQLATYESKISLNAPRNVSLQLTQNNFTNALVQASGGGAILYWTSQSRGISIKSNNNNFSKISTTQESGAIFSLKYNPTNTTISTNSSQSPEYLAILNSTFDYYNQIEAQKGSILYAEGLNTLMKIHFEKGAFQSIQSKSNGGVLMIDPGTYAVSTAFSYSSTSKRILDQHSPTLTTDHNRMMITTSQKGAIFLLGNNFTDISAVNGGVLFESTPNESLNITATNNNFTNVSVTSRGGIFFLNQQNAAITGNALNLTCANLTGSFIYSVAGLVDSSNIYTSNTFSNSLPKCNANTCSFGPTNLRIHFIQISSHPNSIYQYEKGGSSTPYAIISNLTSYSLTEHQINFALVYRNTSNDISYYDEVVLDESSQSGILTLTFTTQDGESQSYVSTNCSNSSCTAAPTSIILKGNASDLITVNATYQSDIYTQSQLYYIKLRGCVVGEINNTNTGECLFCKSGTYSLVTNDTKCHGCPIGATCYGGANITVIPGYYRSIANNSILNIVPCNDSGKRCLGGDGQTKCDETYTGIACLQCNSQKEYYSAGKGGTCTTCYDEDKLKTFSALLLLSSILYQIFMVVVTYKENKKVHKEYLEKKKLEESESLSNLEVQGTGTIIATVAELPQQDQQRQQLQEAVRRKKQESQTKLSPGAFIVIFTTFSQIISVLSDFDIGTANTLMNVSVWVGNPNVQAVFSLQCLYLTRNSDLFEALKFDILLYVFSPIVKIILALFFESLRRFFSLLVWKNRSSKQRQRQSRHDDCAERRAVEEEAKDSSENEIQSNLNRTMGPTTPLRTSKRNKSFTRIGAVAIVLFLLEQPGIIAKLCQYLTCTKLDPYASQYYIKSQNSIECYTDQYNSFLYSAIVPALIFWAFLVPFAIFLVLYKKRKSLSESKALRIIFGNFYNAYTKKAFYWGIVVMIFKMSIFILDSVVASSEYTKGIVFMLVIHLYFLLFKRSPPYDSKPLNRGEKYCSFSYMMVLTMVLLRMSALPEWVNKFCDVMIMMSIITTGGYLLINVLWLYIMTAWELIKKLKHLKENRKMAAREMIRNAQILEDALKKLETLHVKEQKYTKKRHGYKDHSQIELQLQRRNAISFESSTK